jgi:N-acetylglutamate synthase-like GNAT family acetyltransferase
MMRVGYTLRNWQGVLDGGIVFGHRSTEDEILSSAALFSYGSALASIGMVMVREDFRRQGLARAVMQHCLAHLPNPATPTMLVARPQGQRLYEQLGFRKVEPIHRLTFRQTSRAQGRADMSPLTVNDFDAIHRLDSEVYGANRESALKAHVAHGDGGAVLRTGPGHTVTAFALKVRLHDTLIVGPVIALEPGVAAALIGTLIGGHEGPVQIDVPDRQEWLLDALGQEGFAHECTCPLMLLHALTLPGHRERLFALTNRSLG